MPPSVERKLGAILSADVVGYSRLMAEDEAGTIQTLGAYRDEIRLLVDQHRGQQYRQRRGRKLLDEFKQRFDLFPLRKRAQPAKVADETLPLVIPNLSCICFGAAVHLPGSPLGLLFQFVSRDSLQGGFPV